MIQARLVSFFPGIPHGNYRLPGPPAGLAACFFLLAIAVVASFRLELKIYRWGLRLLLILWVASAVIIATSPFQPHVLAGELEVSVLNVAQGDSILVISPKGSTLLIDGEVLSKDFAKGKNIQDRILERKQCLPIYGHVVSRSWMLWP
jgi:hypothetical protein